MDDFSVAAHSAPGLPPADEVSALCVQCGICCTDTLYPVAQLEPGEEQFAAELGFRVVERPNGRPAFRLGCHFLRGTACSIYGQGRPNVCGAFFCSLAKKLRKGLVEFDFALARVAEVRQVRAQLEPHLLPGETVSEARHRMIALIEEGQLGEHKALALFMTALQLILDRHFRHAEEQVMSGGDGVISRL